MRGAGCESGKGSASGNAVHLELVDALELPQRDFGAYAEMSVDREEGTRLREEKLGYGDIPARGTRPQDAAAQSRQSQLAKSASRGWTNSPVNRQPRSSLKSAQAACGCRTVDGVDRPRVETARSERHLEPRNPRASGSCRRRAQTDRPYEHEEADKAPQSLRGFDNHSVFPRTTPPLPGEKAPGTFVPAPS
jgi:hypothetical protein